MNASTSIATSSTIDYANYPWDVIITQEPLDPEHRIYTLTVKPENASVAVASKTIGSSTHVLSTEKKLCSRDSDQEHQISALAQDLLGKLEKLEYKDRSLGIGDICGMIAMPIVGSAVGAIGGFIAVFMPVVICIGALAGTIFLCQSNRNYGFTDVAANTAAIGAAFGIIGAVIGVIAGSFTGFAGAENFYTSPLRKIDGGMEFNWRLNQLQGLLGHSSCQNTTIDFKDIQQAFNISSRDPVSELSIFKGKMKPILESLIRSALTAQTQVA